MKKQQSGFTLIELVVVIVLLGILAATALPRFVDLSGDAEQAAVENIAGTISSANSINYAASLVGSNDVVATTAGCTTAAGNLLEDGLPNDYTATADAEIAAGATTNCTLTGPNSQTATFRVTGVAAP